ncbi:response regulator transcription factor [Arthrobacter sp. ERGS1:01]|uniref:response regulator transcription factor n=1 Tax=Arthrobacter sp. ERGS1:01 TaxID=1704044 RepID=UPI000AA4B67D|nr:response regulator transcription factor [Arthrobacter sp. ERGS1:01]
MNLGLLQNVSAIRMAVVGFNYITSLGLAQLLVEAPHLDVAGSSTEVGGALELMESGPLDIVLVDSGMDRAELINTCTTLAAVPNPPRVVVMGDVDFKLAELLFLEGASAILHLGRIAEDLPTLLRVIHGGGASMLNAEALDALKDRDYHCNVLHKERFEGLNARERSVAEGIAEGLTNLQLAAAMHVSEATVKLLVSTVMNKLGVENRVRIAVSVTKAKFL